NDFLLVVNAANIDKDRQWIREQMTGFDCALTDVSDDFALLALQGPRAAAILAKITATPLDSLKNYRFTTGEVAGASAIISRTGYTGEDGFELYLPPGDAERIAEELLSAGEP